MTTTSRTASVTAKPFFHMIYVTTVRTTLTPCIDATYYLRVIMYMIRKYIINHCIYISLTIYIYFISEYCPNAQVWQDHLKIKLLKKYLTWLHTEHRACSDVWQWSHNHADRCNGFVHVAQHACIVVDCWFSCDIDGIQDNCIICAQQEEKIFSMWIN